MIKPHCENCEARFDPMENKTCEGCLDGEVEAMWRRIKNLEGENDNLAEDFRYYKNEFESACERVSNKEADIDELKVNLALAVKGFTEIKSYSLGSKADICDEFLKAVARTNEKTKEVNGV